MKSALNRIRDGESRFRMIVDGLPAIVTLMKPSGELEDVNRCGLDYFGSTLDQLKAWTPGASFHPDDRSKSLLVWRQSLDAGAPFNFEGRQRRADGVYRWFNVDGFPLRDAEEQIALWYLLQTDIDDRKNAEALLAGEKNVFEMVAMGQPLRTVLDAVCTLLDETAESCLGGVLLFDGDGATVEHAIGPKLPPAYLASLEGRAVSAEAGPCGMAAILKTQVVVSDAASDPRWDKEGWPALAKAHGLNSCWSSPILSLTGEARGTFAIYRRDGGHPTPFHLELLQKLTHIASIAVERERSQTSVAQALEERKGSEGRLRTIIDTIPTIVWSTAPDGTGEFWNERWHDYSGMSAEAARAGGWRKITYPGDGRRIGEVFQTSIDTGQPGEVEGRFRRHNGEYRWFLVRFEPLRDASGLITSWYGVNIDIDDRKQAEALLAGEKRLLEMIADGHPMAETLEALCRFVEDTVGGCRCSVVLVDAGGTHLEHCIAPSLPASFINAIDGRPMNVDSGPCAMAATLNEQVIATDLTSETRWAAYAWSSMALEHGVKACWSTPIASAAGKVLGAFAIYYDEPTAPTPRHHALIEQLTHIASIAVERAQSDAALKRGEAFLAEAQRLSSTGSFSWSLVTNEITWSDQLYRIYEFDRGTPLRLEIITTRVHPEDLQYIMEVTERAQRDGRDFECEYRLQMPDQSIKYVHMMSHAGRDQDGGVEYLGAVQDVTQRRQAEEAVGKARSELTHVTRVMSLGALTASIAHEVNQPLSGIITNASTGLRMLNADPPNVEGALETVRRTLRDGNRASDVIKRLRALFAKGGAATETLDLNEAAREVIALSRSELQRSRVVLQTEFFDDLPLVTGDRVQLQQVILNLLLNAADAMNAIDDRPRQIMISTARDEGDSVRLAVRDVGAGFEPHAAERLFEAFYTTKSAGMGIGLSVSRTIIESHHGRLWAAANDGPGATFSFAIPRERSTVAGPTGG